MRIAKVTAKPWGGLCVRFAAYALGVISIAGAWWLHTTFGHVSMEQVLLHWRFAAARDSVDPGLVDSFIEHVLAYPLLFAGLATWMDARLRRPAEAQAAVLPAVLRWPAHRLPWIAALAGGCTFAASVNAIEFLESFKRSNYFASHYVAPTTAALHAAPRTKNLVLVYGESLETTYAEPHLFHRNLLQPLTDLGGVSFSRYQQMPGTGWTMAAIVSTQCGVPFKMVSLLDSANQGEQLPHFLAGATCLSDLLHSAGYRNVFMGGASLTYSGKGTFLRDHHYDEAYGRREWHRAGIPDQRFSGWGLHDDDLFANAKDKLRELHAAHRPFNLVVLTVDTHLPSGQVSAQCKALGVNALDEIIGCSAAQIADFVRFVHDEGFDEDTNVVVLGDHLAMRNTLWDRLQDAPNRHVFNAFFAKQAPVKNRDDIVHFDMLPTLLDFIGIASDDGRLALGTSGFAGSVRVPDDDDRRLMADGLLQQSAAYAQLWEPRVAQAPAMTPR